MDTPAITPQSLRVVTGQKELTLCVEADGKIQNIRVSTANAFALAADLMEGAVQLMEETAAPQPPRRSALRLLKSATAASSDADGQRGDA